MRFFIKILLLLMVSLGLMHIAQAQELDSLSQRVLSDKLTEYFSAMERAGTDVQKEESDFLISTAEDSLVRQFIALKIYDHYLNSPVMGSEAVAIHVLDKWFIPGKIRMKNDIDFINARVYADFNRQSQVGMKAPELHMRAIDDKAVTLFADGSHDGRYSVLYFYDTDCSKCKVETILLRNVLEDNSFPVNLIAVYTGDDKEAWKDYASRQLALDSDKTTVLDLWDPEFDSDFQRKYGVLQTPRMFLIRPDGIIVGRGLDTEALYIMLHDIFKEVDLNYGSDESAALFDEIFASDDGTLSPSAESIADLASYIEKSTLQKGDTVMFRQLSGDLLYYLSTRSGEGVKEGLKFLLDKSIYGQPEVWDSQDDSLKIIGFADIMNDLLLKAEPGTLIPDLRLPAEKISKGRSKKTDCRLRKIRGTENIILFYTEGCETCKAEKAAILGLTARNRNIRALFVNVDEILASDPSLSEKMFDSFDLSSLPYIIQTDRKGIIMRRYLSYR